MIENAIKVFHYVIANKENPNCPLSPELKTVARPVADRAQKDPLAFRGLGSDPKLHRRKRRYLRGIFSGRVAANLRKATPEGRH